MLHYGCDRGIVVTSSKYTDPAIQLANKDARVTLYDGKALEGLIKKYLPRIVPEFNWDDYDRIVRNYNFPSLSRRRRYKSRYRRY